MDMKNVIWVDVGTHLGQELMVALGPSWPIVVSFLRRFLSAYLFRRGTPYSLKSMRQILLKRGELTRSANFKTIAVEANIGLLSKPVYNFADQAFALALGKTGKTELTKLYFINGRKGGQGSSIFNIKKGTNINCYTLTPILDPAVFFYSLKQALDHEYSGSNYEIILRLNCEGAEGEVIRDCHEIFGERLLLAMGSLKDVREIKGEREFASLNSFLTSKKIKFVPFSCLWETWSPALEAIASSLTE